MNVTATYNGSSVTICSIVGDGQYAFVSYVDGSGNLIVDKIFVQGEPTTIATSATVVS